MLMLVPCALILVILSILSVFFSISYIDPQLKELFQFREKNINHHKIYYKIIYKKKIFPLTR
jgi:hypothetical protein